MRVFATLIFLFAYFSPFAQEKLSLVVPTGHTRPVQNLTYSKDSLWLASVDFEPDILLWDFATGKQLLRLSGHQTNITNLNFFDGLLFSAGNDGQLIEWNLETAKPDKIFNHQSAVNGFLVMQNKIVSITDQGMCHFWQQEEGSLIDTVKLSETELTSLCLSNDRELLISDKNGKVYLLDPESNDTLRSASISEKEINTSAFFKDKWYLGNSSGELIILDRDLNVDRIEQVMGFRIYDLAVDSLSGQIFVSGRDESGHIKKLDIASLTPDGEVEFPAMENPLGIRSVELTKNGILYGTPQGTIVKYNINQKEAFQYDGEASPVNMLTIVEDELFLANSDHPVKKVDLKGIKSVKSISSSGEGIKTFNLDPLGNMLVTLSESNELIISDPVTGRMSYSQEINSRYSSTPIIMDPSGTFIVRKNHPDYLTVYRTKGDKSEKLNVDGFRFKFSEDGRKLFVLNQDGIEVFEVPKFKKLFSIESSLIQDFDISENQLVAVGKDDKSVDIYSLDGRKIKTISFDSVRIERLTLHPDGNIAYTYQISLGPNNQSRDFSIVVLDLEEGKVLGRLTGHSGFIRAIDFYDGGAYAFTASADGKINIYKEGQYGEPIGTIISLGAKDMVVVTPNGLYDATPEAMKSLHYSKGGDILTLNQFKQSFFEPNLLPRLLGIIDEPLPDKDISKIKLHPEVDIKHPNLNDGKLGISLNDMGGGIGKVVIIINGKEVARDARTANLPTSGSQEFDYQISNHPYLKNDEINRITIKAYNLDGSLSSEEKNIYVFPDKKKDEKDLQRFYAIIAGTSDYEGEQMDLKFAAKDAEDFAAALSISAANQFGEENTKIALLTTNDKDRGLWPTKSNIDSVFNHFSQEARASDYLLVYLSGHGVNDEDFYYLTPGASNQKVESLDEANTISSSELTEMIKKVAALQQVLIIDACHSGRFANELMQLTETTTMGTDQIKAIERMKDRTGMYVLAGSKADAVSYEAALFEQGLLTYSILFGMKGAALKSGNSIDVIDLFQFVNEKVPDLAEEIGGVQKPELRYPNNATSFVIGKMEEEDKKKIQIVESKPVFILSNFQEELTIADPLKFTAEVNQSLRKTANEDDKLVFIDKNSFAGGYSVWGRYSITEDLISVRVNLIRDQEIIGTFTEEGLNVDLLAAKIVDRVVNMIN